MARLYRHKLRVEGKTGHIKERIKIAETESVKEYIRNYAKKSLRAFLDGEENLIWITKAIRNCGIYQHDLQEIFDELRGYGDGARYQEILKECKKQKLL